MLKGISTGKPHQIDKNGWKTKVKRVIRLILANMQFRHSSIDQYLI
jgi:hypothetical protein